MEKFEQIKIEFEYTQTEGSGTDNNQSVSSISECKVISLTSYIEQKKSESDKTAIHNSLLGLAAFFPKNTK